LEKLGLSTVRARVGTRKGVFVLTSDAKSTRWGVSGLYYCGSGYCQAAWRLCNVYTQQCGAMLE